MPISFTNREDDPPVVETVEALSDDEYEEDYQGEDESQVSASDFDGDLNEIPLRMMFGTAECGAIFSLPSDKGAFLRVCGCNLERCRRNHQTSRLTNRAKPGSYETVKSRKYVDGKLETWIPMEEYETDMRALKVKQGQEFAEAAALLAKVRTPDSARAYSSPSGSEEDAYALAVNQANFGPGPEGPTKGLFSPGVWDKKPSPGEMVSIGTDSHRKDKKVGVVKDEKPGGKVVAEDQEEKMASPDMMKSMMDLMSGMQNHLKEVEGGLKEIRKEQIVAKHRAETTKDRVEEPRIPFSGSEEELKLEAQAIREGRLHGSNLSPVKFVEKARTLHKEWYAVLKGKEGASGVFASYEEARVLVYRVSGAIWKKFRTYDEAWLYLQARLEEDEGQEPEWYYGVANGKDGFSGVLSEYPTAQELVERVSGASWKKFRTHEEATRFVQLHRRDLKAPSPRRGGARRAHFGDPSEEARSLSPRGECRRIQAPMSVTPDPRSSEGGVFDGRNPRGYGEVGKMFEGYRPPLELAGEDPSTGKDDEIWGMDLGAGEIALREKLCPPDLPVGLQKGLADGMIDAVAQPGGSMGGADTEVSETEILGHALNELVYQGRGGT